MCATVVAEAGPYSCCCCGISMSVRAAWDTLNAVLFYNRNILAYTTQSFDVLELKMCVRTGVFVRTAFLK